MPLLTLDQLFDIASSSPDFDREEEQLRTDGNTALADDLLKLQQDAGIQIDRVMNGFDENEPAPGEQTAALNAAYEPVTTERFDTLRQAHRSLKQGQSDSSLDQLLSKWSAPSSPETPTAPKSPKTNL